MVSSPVRSHLLKKLQLSLSEIPVEEGEARRMDSSRPRAMLPLSGPSRDRRFWRVLGGRSDRKSEIPA